MADRLGVARAGASARGVGGPLARLRRELELSQRVARRLWPLLLLPPPPTTTGTAAAAAGAPPPPPTPPLVSWPALDLELRVGVALARVEAAGVAVDLGPLRAAGRAMRRRTAELERRARALLPPPSSAGCGGAAPPLNLASAAQLSRALYAPPAEGGLGLRPPPPSTSRGAAKTHTPTDAASLRALAARRPLGGGGGEGHGALLPALVLEWRALTNARNKWVQERAWTREAEREAAEDAGAGGLACLGPARARPRWTQTSTATGRLASSAPNVQAVTRYRLQMALPTTPKTMPPTAAAAAAAAAAPRPAPPQPQPQPQQIAVRDAFVAPPGACLVSADYRQVELRLLAHLSGDAALARLFRDEGGGGGSGGAGGGDDPFEALARRWLMGAAAVAAASPASPAATAAAVPPALRERAKRVVYSVCYGVTPYGLAQQLAAAAAERGAGAGGPGGSKSGSSSSSSSSSLAADVAGARALMASFLRAHPGVAAFVEAVPRDARRAGGVPTLAGRWLPLPGLSPGGAPPAAAAAAAAAAEAQAARKAVNARVQGSAADLLKLALLLFDSWCARLERQPPPPHQQQQQQQQQQQRGRASLAPAPPAAPAAPPAHAAASVRVVATVHDELLLEVVPAPGATLEAAAREAAAAARAAMLEAGRRLGVGVPLAVSAAWGAAWGSLAPLLLS